MVLLLSTLFGTLVPLPAPSTQAGAYRGTPFVLTVRLRDQNNIPIQNATVEFYHETHNEFLGTAITNQTGHAQFTWQIPIDHELGPFQLNATFRGDPERFLLPTVVQIPITIFAYLQHIVSIQDLEGNPFNSTMTIGQELVFQIIIQDDHLIPLEGVPVQLVLEPDQVIGEGTTSQNGSLTLNFVFHQSRENIVTFTIRSLNHGFFNGTETSHSFFIGSIKTNFLGLPAFWIGHEGAVISGRLCEVSGQGIQNASVQLYTETESLITSTLTESGGYFQFNLEDKLGIIENQRFLTVQYNGSGGYTGAQGIIGIIHGSKGNPFSHFFDIISSTTLSTVMQQLSIIVISCLTIGTTIFAIRMKQSTRRIVSH
jgi:hypothetical protein